MQPRDACVFLWNREMRLVGISEVISLAKADSDFLSFGIGLNWKKIGLLAGLGFVLITVTRWLMRKYSQSTIHSRVTFKLTAVVNFCSSRWERIRLGTPNAKRLPKRIDQ